MGKSEIFIESVVNTFLEKSFKEELPLTLMELNYLIFFLYADLLYKDYELFEESFIITKFGPVLYSIAHYYGNKNIKITDFMYSGENLDVWMISDKTEIGRVVHARLSYIWNLYKYTYGADLLKYLKENYCNVFSTEDFKEIDDDDILKDEINIHEEILYSAKKRCMSYPRSNL